jgi:hypothetical protein
MCRQLAVAIAAEGNTLHPRQSMILRASLLLVASATLSAQVTSFGAAIPTLPGVTPTIGLPSSIYVNGGTTELDIQGPASAVALLLVGASNTTWSGTPLPFDLAQLSPQLRGMVRVSGDLQLAVQLNSQGRRRIQLPEIPFTNDIFVQALVSDPQTPQAIGGSTQGWRIRPQGAPTIGMLSRASMQSDDPLTVNGSNLPQSAPDICQVIESASGELLMINFPTGSTGTTVTSRGEVNVEPNRMGNLVMMAGSGSFLAPSQAPVGVAFGPQDIRVFTGNGQVVARSTQQISTGSSDAVWYPIRYNAVDGTLDVTIPFSATACPPNSRFRFSIDCAIQGDPLGARRWDFNANYTNTVAWNTTTCAQKIGEVFVTGFLMQKATFTIFSVFIASNGDATVKLKPLIGGFVAVNNQKCGMLCIL